MKRTPLSHLRFSLRRVPSAVLLSLAPALHAADRFWITPAGGTHGTAANWSATDGGAGGATVPGVADVANFTPNNTYTVNFGAAATMNALDAENGNVTLDLGGFTCTLTSGGASFIGQVAGQTGRLTVTDGTLAVDTAGDNVNVGNLAGSTGFLTVTTGGFHIYNDGQRLRLLFTRPLDRTGVTLKVQASNDLTTWTDLATSLNSAPFTGAGFVSENRAHPLTEPGLVEVRDLLTPATTPRRQMRVRITLAP